MIFTLLSQESLSLQNKLPELDAEALPIQNLYHFPSISNPIPTKDTLDGSVSIPSVHWTESEKPVVEY